MSVNVQRMPRRFAVIANQSFALRNFRAPLLRDLAANGLEVLALAPDFSDADRDALREMGVQAVDFTLARKGANPARDLLDVVRLTGVLRRHRPDGMLSITVKPAIYGTLAGWMAGVPRRYVLITGLGYAFGRERGSLRRRLVGAAVRALYRLALARAEGVFMQNRDDVEEFAGRGLFSAEKLLGIHATGVDLGEWPPLVPVSHPVTFLLAARLLREKGIPEFAAAAAALKHEHGAKVRFILLGGLEPGPRGVPEAQLREWIRAGLLEWPGHVDVRPWLGQASVFVLPSFYREGVPRSIQEAMASGRPIVTTDSPGCRETVVAGRNGFLVAPRDADALAHAMARFVANPALIATMGRESRRLAEERFDAAAINRRMIAAMGLDRNEHAATAATEQSA